MSLIASGEAEPAAQPAPAGTGCPHIHPELTSASSLPADPTDTTEVS